MTPSAWIAALAELAPSTEIAAAAGVSPVTVGRWLARARAEAAGAEMPAAVQRVAPPSAERVARLAVWASVRGAKLARLSEEALRMVDAMASRPQTPSQ